MRARSNDFALMFVWPPKSVCDCTQSSIGIGWDWTGLDACLAVASTEEIP